MLMLNVVQRDVAPPRLPTAGYSPDSVHAMQRAIIALFSHWGVTDDQAAILLGGISVKTFRRWKKREYGNVGRDLADRMSMLLGIHKALRVIYSDTDRGYRWIGANSDVFGGKTALSVMLQGGSEDIRRVRTYLDAVRGGW
jgi:hypothetical protein